MIEESNLTELPEGWTITELETISNKITDGTHKTPKYVEKGIPFLSTSNITFFFHLNPNHKGCQKPAYKSCLDDCGGKDVFCFVEYPRINNPQD